MTLNLLSGAQQLKRVYEKMCEDISLRHGLTRLEIDILLFLANNPEYDTAKDIVEIRYLSKSHVSKSVESLTKRGFLRGRQDQRDRRCVHLKIQEEAWPVVREAQRMQAEFFALLFRGFTPEERGMLETAHARMSQNIREAWAGMNEPGASRGRERAEGPPGRKPRP